ncbi:hypothetical protein JHK87_011379 [Glycine soja]|nr:hypothetical protein JHK87_011379 [Glycine soja]
MDVRNIAVVVEDVDAARTALQWALHNIIRYGDIITLLHVYPLTRSKSKNKARVLRLRGFQLALSFQDICNNFSNTKVEIVVTEENKEGMKIVAMVRQIGASMLVVGLHDQSFLYRTWVDLSNLDSAQHENESAVASELQKLVTENLGTCTCLLNALFLLIFHSLAMVHSNIANYFNCRVLAINQPPASPLSPMVGVQGSSANMDFSQIDISRLQVPERPPPKVKYRICPDPTAIIYRLRRSRRRR